jgi:ATP-dependent Clp protease adaptor protein ClpS
MANNPNQSNKQETCTKVQQLILLNDRVNTFEHVIECLVKIVGHDPIQAEQCAFIAHYRGRCSIKTGDTNAIQALAEKLKTNRLTVSIEP